MECRYCCSCPWFSPIRPGLSWPIVPGSYFPPPPAEWGPGLWVSRPWAAAATTTSSNNSVAMDFGSSSLIQTWCEDWFRHGGKSIAVLIVRSCPLYFLLLLITSLLRILVLLLWFRHGVKTVTGLKFINFSCYILLKWCILIFIYIFFSFVNWSFLFPFFYPNSIDGVF